MAPAQPEKKTEEKPKKQPRYRVRALLPDGFFVVSKPVKLADPEKLEPMTGEPPQYLEPEPLGVLPVEENPAFPTPPEPKPRVFELKLCDDEGNPRVGLRWTLDIGPVQFNGYVGDDGLLQCELPFGAREGKLTIGGDGGDEIYDLDFGLEDIKSIGGAQQRLATLGYDCDVSKDLDEKTKAALRAFQADSSLPETGAYDDQTQRALDAAFKNEGK
ncbi:MAG: peptidoglycan-binding protein [Deltaproteobacteria bacterium]|nr:peptidoglycan-binding protein [Deltaproteobacteria bacterium]